MDGFSWWTSSLDGTCGCIILLNLCCIVTTILFENVYNDVATVHIESTYWRRGRSESDFAVPAV